MTENHGVVWWNELNTRDPQAAMDYYGKTLGWSFDEMEMAGGGTYYVAMHGGKPTAGVYDMSADAFLDGVPAHWFTYFAVDDIDATIKVSDQAKGSVRRAAVDIPGVGRMAIMVDPSGAVMGMMTPECETD